MRKTRKPETVFQSRDLKKSLFVFFLAIILGILAGSSSGQAKFTVSVKVSGSSAAKSDFESYLKRELRSLGDVEVSDTGRFGIAAVLMENRMQNGANAGYVASSTSYEIIYCSEKIYFDLLDNLLNTGAKDDLRKIAESVVTEFDTSVLEKRRKLK